MILAISCNWPKPRSLAPGPALRGTRTRSSVLIAQTKGPASVTWQDGSKTTPNSFGPAGLQHPAVPGRRVWAGSTPAAAPCPAHTPPGLSKQPRALTSLRSVCHFPQWEFLLSFGGWGLLSARERGSGDGRGTHGKTQARDCGETLPWGPGGSPFPDEVHIYSQTRLGQPEADTHSHKMPGRDPLPEPVTVLPDPSCPE